MISTDCHAGLPPEKYRDYLDPQHRAAFDHALPIQIEMTRAAERQFLVADINAEWRRGREQALSGAWDHDERTRVMDGDGVAGEVICPDGITEMNAIPGKELGKDDFTKVPNGLPSVGDRLPVMWTYGVRAGRMTPNQFVALTSSNPGKIFRLYPRKGALLPGSDADIVIWDPERRLTYGIGYAQHRTDYNLFENWELVGYPEKVFLRGHLIVDGEKWLGSPGMGRYLYRNPHGIIL